MGLSIFARFSIHGDIRAAFWTTFGELYNTRVGKAEYTNGYLEYGLAFQPSSPVARGHQNGVWDACFRRGDVVM